MVCLKVFVQSVLVLISWSYVAIISVYSFIPDSGLINILLVISISVFMLVHAIMSRKLKIVGLKNEQMLHQILFETY